MRNTMQMSMNMIKSVVYTLSLLTFFFVIADACPDGWLKHADSCYFFSHDTEGWTEALTLCKLFGGSLVEIESQAENDYLAKQASLFRRRYFIAMADIVEEGIWRWMNSGAMVVEGFSNWNPGEPNNYKGQGEDCGLIYTSGKWNDGVCHNPEYYICETPDESGVIIG